MPPVNPTGKLVYVCDEVVTACNRIFNLVFPGPGVYFAELYSQGGFLDDRLVRLH